MLLSMQSLTKELRVVLEATKHSLWAAGVSDYPPVERLLTAVSSLQGIAAQIDELRIQLTQLKAHDEVSGTPEHNPEREAFDRSLLQDLLNKVSLKSGGVNEKG